jgi:hypothetical protein
MKVKVDKNWTGRSRLKKELMSQLENCSQEEFEASTRDFYVGRSLIGERREIDDETDESRNENRTRVLHDKWVGMHFKKPFLDMMDTKFHQWHSVSKETADEIKVKMEDQGKSIHFIHKYRDAVTNGIKYCVAKANTGGKQKSRSVHILKHKEIDIDWIHGLCRDQLSMEWYH